MTKKLFRKKIYFIKSKPNTSIIKNKAVNHFLLQHLIPQKLNLEGAKNSILYRFSQDDSLFDNIFEKSYDIKESEQSPLFNLSLFRTKYFPQIKKE